MKYVISMVLTSVFALALCGAAEDINFNWRFAKGDQKEAVKVDFDDSAWEQVDLPHDWAISGPFGKPGEDGGTGKLPWKGEGWYRKRFELSTADKGRRLQFIFDGVMAAPTIFLNGVKVGSWRYGYNSFWIDATDAARFGGENVLVVHADTREHTSRWYPGGGIYRKITMRLVNPVHIPVWGVLVTTPTVTDQMGAVKVQVEVTNTLAAAKNLFVEVVIKDPQGGQVDRQVKAIAVAGGRMKVAELRFKVEKPQRWDVDSPVLYTVESRLLDGRSVCGSAETTLGFRTFEWTVEDGFHLNGRRVQLYGVNMHHDQGPLGAAFFPRAMERQLQMMKDMGVNALRTSHNASAPEVQDLCDRMGIIVFNELFDKYGPTAGVQCSTADFVNEYAEKEVRNFVLRDRNHPSVCLWSIGNEINEILNDSDGKAAEHVAAMVSYFRKYDPTRPTTMGNHIPGGARKEKHILDKLDTSGWNYGQKYLVAKENYPDKPLIYSESGSVFGTRGAYKLKLPENKTDWGKDGYLSAYCLTSARWSDIPEHEFERMIKHKYVAGEFVWTGFDYLGEPTPFSRDYADAEGRLARSSYFGIVDLAGLPKDSYYLYRSHWNQKRHTIYLTPHWNWQEGDSVPVFLYTDGDEAELFLNGKSLGRRKKVDRATLESKNLAFGKTASASSEEHQQDKGGNVIKQNPYFNVVDIYRLRWMDVPYAPGEIKAVAYKKGQKIGAGIVRTAGMAAKLRVTPDRMKMQADGMDLCYVTVEMVDQSGQVCPLAMDNLTFKVSGAAKLAGVANGDQMGFDSFTDNRHPLFYGKAVAVLRSVPGKSGPAGIAVVADNGMTAECEVVFGE